MKSLIIPVFLSFLMMGCNSSKTLKNSIELESCVLEKGAFSISEKVPIQLIFKNSGHESVTIEKVTASIMNISDTLETKITTVDLLNDLTVDAKSSKTIETTLLEEIPSHFKNCAYGVYISYAQQGMTPTSEKYETFFRVVGEDVLTVFDIKSEQHNGVPVFRLDGGMSAEYVIEKSAENLTSGISHSWDVNAPGSGPNHVLSTHDYLKKSVNQTVDFYDRTFGEDQEIETVLITTGFPSIPYISNAMKAPVLPLHFLVSVNTAKEIQTILKTANRQGIASYATLSHDPSVPYAVAWVKLLSLPNAYRNFIKKHNVKNIVVMGATGTSEGETKAKQLLYDENITEEYSAGSIYIMYPGTSPDDVKTLNTKIVDLKDFKQQENFIRITDWESGINQKQLTNFVEEAKNINPSILASTITAEDLGQLYNLGTYSVLALMHKNGSKFNNLTGVIFNPYLLAHPVIEAKKGYVPLLYWQLVGANYTVHKLENDVFRGIRHYYPDTKTKDLKLWFNSTRNFGAVWSASKLKKELAKKGYSNFIDNNYDVDEVWDLSNGIDAPSELLFEEISKGIGFKKLKEWNDSIIPLTIEDIKTISTNFGGFEVEIK